MKLIRLTNNNTKDILYLRPPNVDINAYIERINTLNNSLRASIINLS